jgi:glycosyltransferase involved in cell wall biosynthesis
MLSKLLSESLDVAHCGLKQGLGELWPDLSMIIQDWSMINGPAERPSSNWRLSLNACLIRRELILQLGSLDTAFVSLTGAGLELGYRYYTKGALVEYRPELHPEMSEGKGNELVARDLYSFVLRHFGKRWAKYLSLRRSLGWLAPIREQRIFQEAQEVCASSPVQWNNSSSVWFAPPPVSQEELARTPVSVIIPTLGRYPYLPEALASLRRQTVKPREVIVVDQNPPERRQPEVYRAYEDLNMRVIWQDERGQSLARNTGLAVASSPYVFLFDDDSIAHDDLIEAHLRLLIGTGFQVSTGVAYPPPPSDYTLPPKFRYPRLAQTFDTGNSLLPLSLARELGGLDRNYDYGPGTDLDFGTRMYLAGVRIVHNPRAVRIHFKAPLGGLRTHGVRKYNSDTGVFTPFPPITQAYYGLRYLNKAQRRERILIQFITSKLPKEVRRSSGKQAKKLAALLGFVIKCFLFPLKYNRSYKQAKRLIQRGIQLEPFPSSSLSFPKEN